MLRFELEPDTPYLYNVSGVVAVSVVERTYVLAGMTCGHCELSVREEVEELTGVESATADATTGRLLVRGETVEDAAVREAVTAAGYRLVW
jgi:copper chaperone CopZ